MDTYIYGNTFFSKKVAAIFSVDFPNQFKGYIVDKEFMNEEDDNIIAWEDFCERPHSTNFEILVTIGYTHMNEGRKKVFEKIKKYNYRIGTYISSSALVSPGVQIGEGCIILQRCLIEPNCIIGNGNILDGNATIAHNTTINHFNWFGMGSVVLGDINIGSNCFFGANSTIRDNLVIGDETLVGAGAYINNNTESGQVIVPARSVVLNKTSREIKI